MPKRQECALTISSEHSDLAAASVIWFTCCSQAAAAAAAIRAGSQSICEFSGGSEENPSGTGLKRKRRSVLDSEVSHASDMPKRQECALTISSEHSDLAAASVIWFTCCSQAAAAAAAIRAGSQSICEFSGGSEENPSGTGLKRKRRSVLDSEVSHASDMPKRQECALTISSEHSDLAAASVIWFTCCSQAAAAAAAIRAGSQSICEFSGGSEENPSGTGLKRKRRSVLDSEVSHASDMPKRQECALTISSEHSDLAAASVIWFTCCSQAAAAAAAIRAGSQSICEFSGGSEENPSGTGLKRKRRSVLDSEVSHASDMPKRQECALTISSEHSDLAAASVIWFTCCSQAAAAAAAIRAGSQSICEFSGGSEENPSGTGLKRKRRSVLDSEVSHASDMPKRQECALTISSEHSDLAAASVIWFTCCSQASSSSSRYPCRQSVYL
uniref:Uncharacterized protein n=2 Tax=Macrostomum lignano TaxID=282301 RepID=A0A1I8HGF2_9PLAT